jgi:opacity protein-like surface antigen
MFHLKALALASVTVVALAGAASAADLLPPPPPLEPPPPIVSADMGGWYLRGDVGVGVSSNASITSDAAIPAGGSSSYYNDSMSEAALFDIGVGYQVNSWFRADVTGELRGGSTFEGLQNCANCGSPQLYDFYHGHVSSAIGLVNGYVDLGNWYGVTPYVGAGVGLAVNRVTGATDQGANYTANAGFPTGGYFDNASKTNLAWALMAGLDFSVTHNLKLELGYRFLDYGKFTTGAANCLNGTGGFNACGFKVASKELYSNDFRIGLRYYLDSPPPPEPGPLVRKY